MRDYVQLSSGLYGPPLPANTETRMETLISSPMMQYLTMAIYSGWAWDEGNADTAWDLPVYSQLAMIQEVTMAGIDLIRERNDLQQSKGWALTGMMARGISLSRMSCLALATGSFSDAFASYRMLLDRLITLKYLESNGQYEAFAKYSYAQLFHRVGSQLNDGEFRDNSTSGEINSQKEWMALIRRDFFEGTSPHKPEHYWKPPYTADLVASALSGDDSLRKKQVSYIYELGNRSVHPWVRDLIQPEDSDIASEDLMGMILITAADLSAFGLSLHPVTSILQDEVYRIVTDTPQQAIPVWEHVANTHIRIEQILAR